MPPVATAAASEARAKAVETQRALQSPRYQRLDMLERYVDGTQYEGKLGMFADSDVPLFDRAPCFVHLLPKLAIRSHASMVLGEGRFPAITTHGDEDDGEEDDDEAPPSSKPGQPAKATPKPSDTSAGGGLDEDDSKVIDRLVRKIIRQTKLQPAARKDLRAAMACGSSVAIVSAHLGRLVVDIVKAKNCTAKRDNPENPGEVTSLEIRYPFIDDSEVDARNRTIFKCKIYRRVIDAQADTEFEPYEPLSADSAQIPDSAWQVKQRVAHGFGFCPVRWYKFMAEEDGVAAPDGHSLHGLLLEELTILDFVVSQRARAVLYNGDPVVIETGVDPEYNASPIIDPFQGGTLSPEAFVGGSIEERARVAEAMNSQWGYAARLQSRSVGKGRKRAPGMFYKYPQGADAKYLSLPADAMVAAEKCGGDLKAEICEALSWVPIDPKQMQMGADISGRAIEWLHKKQIDFDKEIRTDYGDHGLLPLIDLLLRVVYSLGKAGKAGGLYLDGLAEAMPILARFEREQETGAAAQQGQAAPTRKVWMPPEIDLVWPPFFTATAADAKADGDNVRADLLAGLIKKPTAITKIAGFYGIKDPAAYAEAMAAEEAAKTAELHAAQAMLAGPGAPGTPAAKPPASKPAATPRPAKPKPPAAAFPPGRMMGGRLPPPAAAPTAT